MRDFFNSDNLFDNIRGMDGWKFQTFCQRLFLAHYGSKFNPTRKYVKDGSNDGYIEDTGEYFHMYGGKNPKPSEIIKKFRGDAQGCLNVQVNVKKMTFVCSSDILGTDPPEIQKIKAEFNLEAVEYIGPEKLIPMVQGLPIKEKCRLFNIDPYDPNPESMPIRYEKVPWIEMDKAVLRNTAMKSFSLFTILVLTVLGIGLTAFFFKVFHNVVLFYLMMVVLAAIPVITFTNHKVLAVWFNRKNKYPSLCDERAYLVKNEESINVYKLRGSCNRNGCQGTVEIKPLTKNNKKLSEAGQCSIDGLHLYTFNRKNRSGNFIENFSYVYEIKTNPNGR